MKVEIYDIENSTDHKAGTIHWDGNSFSTEPPDNVLLKNILDSKVFNEESVEMTLSKSDPEGFLRNLHRKYRSPYLRASKVVN